MTDFSVLRESTELLELRGKVRDLPLTVEELKGFFALRQTGVLPGKCNTDLQRDSEVTRTQAQCRRSVYIAFLTDHPLPVVHDHLVHSNVRNVAESWRLCRPSRDSRRAADNDRNEEWDYVSWSGQQLVV